MRQKTYPSWILAWHCSISSCQGTFTIIGNTHAADATPEAKREPLNKYKKKQTRVPAPPTGATFRMVTSAIKQLPQQAWYCQSLERDDLNDCSKKPNILAI